jgi:hypothetical protein
MLSPHGEVDVDNVPVVPHTSSRGAASFAFNPPAAASARGWRHFRRFTTIK